MHTLYFICFILYINNFTYTIVFFYIIIFTQYKKLHLLLILNLFYFIKIIFIKINIIELKDIFFFFFFFFFFSMYICAFEHDILNAAL